MIRAPTNRNAAYSSARFMPTSYPIGWTPKTGCDRSLGAGSSRGGPPVLRLLTRTLGWAYDVYMIVANAIYVDGRRAVEPTSLQETYEACREQHGLAWIGLYEPTEEEFSSVAEEFGLHPLAVEDAIKAHHRPKLERYGETLFVVLRPARYIDETETVEFGEIHVFVGRDFVVTVRHGEASALHGVRRRLESEPELLRKGPEAILYAITDRMVDDYGPVVEGLENDIDEIETEVFGGNAGVSRGIYELSRKVIEFQRAARPLTEILGLLVGTQRSSRTPNCGATCATCRITPYGCRIGSRVSESCCRTSSASTSRSWGCSRTRRSRRSPRRASSRTTR